MSPLTYRLLHTSDPASHWSCSQTQLRKYHQCNFITTAKLIIDCAYNSIIIYIIRKYMYNVTFVSNINCFKKELYNYL